MTTIKMEKVITMIKSTRENNNYDHHREGDNHYQYDNTKLPWRRESTQGVRSVTLLEILGLSIQALPMTKIFLQLFVIVISFVDGG